MTPKGRGWVLAAVVAAPDRIVLLLFWTCLVVAPTVLLGVFRPVVVLPALAAVVVATWRLVPRRLAATRSSALGAGGVLVLAVAWFVANAPYASEYVVVARDPGFLTLEGVWLSSHPAPEMPLGRTADLIAAVPGIGTETEAYVRTDDVMHAQGAKLIPGLLGIAGWLGGTRAILVANLVIGAIALIAVYALARRLMPALWALVPTVALALTLPMIAFSRAAYSEPATLALVFGGLTMAWSAYETRSWWRHLLAGALVGAGALARIDGAASVIGLIAAGGVAAGAALGVRRRRDARVALAMTGVGGWAMAGLGYTDLRLHSPGYLADLGSQFRSLLGAMIAVTVLCALAASPWWPASATRSVLRHRHAWAAGIAAATAATCVLLASRPLWLVSRTIGPDHSATDYIANLQRAGGLPIDPTRTYDEMTFTWLAWYLGWVTVVAAVAGLAYAAYRGVRWRDPRLLVVLAVVAAPSALYLWQTSITPDQVWAMRRFLPVTIPGFLVMAAFGLHALWRRGRGVRPVAAVAAVVVAFFPLATWSPALRVVEQGGRLDEARAICAAVGDGPVLYVHDVADQDFFATIRILCDVDTARVVGPVTPALLQQVRDVWGPDTAVVTFEEEDLPWSEPAPPAPMRVSPVSWWERSLVHVPLGGFDGTSQVWVGHIAPDGTVTPVSTPQVASPDSTPTAR